MENIIFSIFDGIELINKKLFYLVIPYGTKIINHIKENTLGSIMLIILIIVILNIINKVFKKKYGHPIVTTGYLFLSPVGAFLYGGKYWLEYAIRNNKIKWYPIGFILFFLISIVFLGICIILKIIKEKNLSDFLGFLLTSICFLILYGIAKDLVILFIFFLGLGVLGGAGQRNGNTYIIEHKNDTIGPNF